MSGLAPTLSLLARQPLESFGQQLVLINPPGADAASQLDPLDTGISVYLDCPSFQRHGGPAGHHAQLGLSPLGEEHMDHAIVFLARQRRRTDCLLAYAASVVPAGAPIWLVGENRAGIKASGKRLAAVGERVEKLDNARHCSLFATRNRARTAFSLDTWQEQLTYNLDGTRYTLCQLPGVFASRGLDEGTAFLLDNLPALDGDVLDIGCGNGVLGLALKLRHGDAIKLTGIDADALAVKAAECNAESLRLDGEFTCGDLFPEDGRRFQHIVTNPPFHGQGPQNDLAITQRLISGAKERLVPGGQLWMVCNRFLPWRAQLSKHFDEVETIAEDRRYSVLAVRRA